MQANAGSVVIKSEHIGIAGGYDEASDYKSELRNSKVELFNKLVAIQSEQTLVNTTLGNNEGGDNLSQALSSRNNVRDHDEAQLVTGCIIDPSPHQQLHVRQYQSPINLSDQNLNNGNDSQNTSPPDLKRDATVFSSTRSRWYTNEEVSSILTNFKLHPEWQTNELQVRPKSGAVLLYSRERVRYRQDGYCWKKRKNGRTTREDHMKLKVQGIECIYGCYVHSAILPTFHRRCYWLLQNPDIVLVHYLNQPPDDQNKMMITFNSSLLEADTRRSWTNEEIIEEIGSVFGGISQIQHMLNINFPSSNAIIPPQQSQMQNQISLTSDIVNEISPHLQPNTSNSKPPTGQIGVPLIEQGLLCDAVGDSSPQREKHGENQVELEQSIRDTCDENDEKMTTLRPDGNNNSIATNQIGNCLNSLHHNHLDGSKNMAFDIVDDCIDSDESNANSSGQLNVDCFGYNDSASESRSGLLSTNEGNIGLNQPPLQQTENQMEQNVCSPVTQIYNKIVDDIETYALPLEPNHFDAEHHHHHHHHHHQHEGQNHHSMSVPSMPSQPMEVVELKDQNHGNEGRQCRIEVHGEGRRLVTKQFIQDSHIGVDLNKRKSTCSMDLSTECDLFGSHEDGQQCQVDDGSARVHEDEGVNDNLLLTEFNLQTSEDGVDREADDLDSSVVDSLANADDLRDLIMGISSDRTQVDHANSLIDNNALDIFNFKIDYGNQTRVQLDMQSSTSDTETMNRISPLVPMPRCNSTGNSMQGPIQMQNEHPSDLYLEAYNGRESSHHMDSSTAANTFDEFLASTVTSNPRRSLSTNPVTNSDSHSPTPSTSSLRVESTPSQTRSIFIGENTNQMTSSRAFLRGSQTRQQRQKSEQRTLSNSALSTLLPKAISLDSNDLSTTSHHQREHYKHRLSNCPLISYGDAHDIEQQNGSHNLLLITSASSKQPTFSSETTTQQVELSRSCHQQINLGSSLSSVIPTTNSKDILINNAATNNNTNFQHGSLNSYNNSTLQPVQQSTANQSFIIQAKRANSSLNNVLPILDYVPNWSNTTGGAKVLIVGNWSSLLTENTFILADQQLASVEEDSSNSPFYAIFDNLLVPATLIQDNVLRCYAPGHEQGFITLKVLYMNRIVTEQVLFEMRPSCIQAANKQVATISYPKHNNQSGQDSSIDNNCSQNITSSGSSSSSGSSGNNNNTTSNNSNSNTQQQHRNSTSSNHSTSSSSVFANQRQPQVSPIGDNLRVLTLAENIISAMHKKNNSYVSRTTDSFRLANSLDIESLDHYQKQLHSQSHIQRNRSIKAGHRYLNGFRSLSRDSEPVVSSSSSYAAMDFGVIDSDPYWHQNILSADSQQPLSVVTDSFLPGAATFGQERHSIGSSSSFLLNQLQSSTFAPYATPQRPILASTNQMVGHCLPNESQNMTETSSSGLGSNVSSLSPSTSSLHSPSSACAAANRETANREDQSPTCSCGRQSTGTPTSADFCEYFQASAKTEESFASLTLNDHEQHELYEAAKIIQKAYRMYRGRKRQASELLIELESVVPERDLAMTDFQTPDNPSASVSAGMTQLNAMDLQNERTTCSAHQQTLEHDRSSALGQSHFNYLNLQLQQQQQQQQQKQQQSTLVRCYRDREMQAATIIQAYYRRYRQYVHYKRQQANSRIATSSQAITLATRSCGGRSPNARLVIDTLPIVIDKATTSHVDRKRLKTASLIRNSVSVECSKN